MGRLITIPTSTEAELKAAVMKILRDHFCIGNSYTYELTRDKIGFTFGTVSLEDFEEWDESRIEELADQIVSKLPKILDTHKPKAPNPKIAPAPTYRKRKYFRKCGVCGERYEQSDMIRTDNSPNGWICHECVRREHPEYESEEI